MSNEGCSVGLGQEGVEILKYLKSGWNKKEGRENKDSKKGPSGSRGGCLEKGDLEPLKNYALINIKYILALFGSVSLSPSLKSQIADRNGVNE